MSIINKIFLVDNTKKKLNIFKNRYGLEFSNLIEMQEYIEETGEGIFPILDNVDLLLQHKNYFDQNSRRRIDAILNYAKKKNTRVILFTNDTATNLLSKDSLYANLSDILRIIQKNNDVKFNIEEFLRYGRISFKKNILLSFEKLKFHFIFERVGDSIPLNKKECGLTTDFLNHFYESGQVGEMIHRLASNKVNNIDFLDKINYLFNMGITTIE